VGKCATCTGDAAVTTAHAAATPDDGISGDDPRPRQGRTSLEQLTSYKSGGVALQDATAATLMLAATRTGAVGREVAL
jgi:hypothetical protein